ncbi:MAG: hypothetical protein BWY02_02683 [bacterium ADurb.Bin157]|nr:MAG: hypothetical protein BWY02_02683 [bacterium ADurb.Bin157]
MVVKLKTMKERFFYPHSFRGRMKRLLCLVLLCLIGCSAKYIIPQGKTPADFKIAVKECQDQVGTKRDNVYVGPFAGDMYIGDDIHNLIVETKFRNCMEEKGYKVAE